MTNSLPNPTSEALLLLADQELEAGRVQTAQQLLHRAIEQDGSVLLHRKLQPVFGDLAQTPPLIERARQSVQQTARELRAKDSSRILAADDIRPRDLLEYWRVPSHRVPHPLLRSGDRIVVMPDSLSGEERAELEGYAAEVEIWVDFGLRGDGIMIYRPGGTE